MNRNKMASLLDIMAFAEVFRRMEFFELTFYIIFHKIAKISCFFGCQIKWLKGGSAAAERDFFWGVKFSLAELK